MSAASSGQRKALRAARRKAFCSGMCAVSAERASSSAIAEFGRDTPVLAFPFTLFLVLLIDYLYLLLRLVKHSNPLEGGTLDWISFIFPLVAAAAITLQAGSNSQLKSIRKSNSDVGVHGHFGCGRCR